MSLPMTMIWFFSYALGESEIYIWESKRNTLIKKISAVPMFKIVFYHNERCAFFIIIIIIVFFST